MSTWSKVYAGLSQMGKIYDGSSPRIWEEYEEPVDPSTPLCFTAKEPGSTVSVSKTGTPTVTDIAYSTDGTTWTSFVPGTTAAITLTNVGDKVYFRNNVTENFSTAKYLYFLLTGNVSVSGNIMSMYDATNFATATTLSYTNSFVYLFSNCKAITSASTLLLPATTLSTYCYYGLFASCTNMVSGPKILPASTASTYSYYRMFSGCTKLTNAPAISATTVNQYGCQYMFNECTSLVTPPVLSANMVSVGQYGCQYMFYGCTSLATAPTLSATTRSNYCYSQMFYGCTSINVQDAVNKLTAQFDFTATTSPTGCQGLFWGLAITDSILSSVLPNYTLAATTLISYAYWSMFRECTLLQTAPNISATTLNSYCCQYMFKGCTALKATPALPATTLKTHCYEYMFQGCSSLTTITSLPFTTLNTYCCQYMFESCTALTSCPALLATSASTRCYMYMFRWCTNLTTAPKISLTTLGAYACHSMFYGCTSLTTAPKLASKKLSATTNYNSMFNGCTSLIVSDTITESASCAWNFPTSGTFTNTSTYAQSNMFLNCAGTRSSNNLAGAAGASYVYYTQNNPV